MIKSRLSNGWSVFLMVILVALLVSSIASCSEEEEPDARLRVAVTIVPQIEFVERVGGDKVEVTVMVPPGASPHTYELTPSQMTELSEAVMYAKVGSGVEFELAWMDNLIDQNKEMLVVDCSEGVQLQESVEEEEHGSSDPHIWMSPRNVQTMVRNIADGLIQIDPDNRDYYEQNRDAYLEELSQLDREISDGLAGVTNRVFMVYHPSFGYFASAYDLTMLPIEDEGKEPTPAGLQKLIDQALEYDIRVVFASPEYNPQSAETIADAIDGCVVMISPLAEDYMENLHSVLEEMVAAMK